MFTFNILLFALFSLLSILRLLKHASHIRAQILSNTDELCYLAAPAIAYLTIVAQVSLTCSQAWGYSWTIVAYVLWWIGLAWTLPLCSFHIIILAKHEIITAEREKASPTMLLPLISVMTLGTTGGLICEHSTAISAAMAVPVIVVGFVAIGYAMFLSLVFYAVLLHKLIAVGLPPSAKLPSLVITVGPMGQFATAIQVLSSAASSRGLFAAYGEGAWLQSSAARSVSAAAVLVALLTLGFGVL
ncbi:hypothetical protein EJ02DRAFT_454793 [Clathrospora elynae]|uniref:C4-dicarboxylate transporter/malic acid transport protein n=1 Tax=Clathrospora elynae TaxID=706981 RepID=A0A6A5SNR1_9PLEO|nr:hypothetical protein EJ02DRAFT_454793 [Clathrospora elynae]